MDKDQIAALVLAARRGDRSAFQKLYELHSTAVYNYVLRMTGSAEDASDILQDIFIKVYRKLADLTEPAAFSGWLFTLARNETLTQLQKKKRRQTEPLDNLTRPDHPQTGMDNPEQHAHQAGLQEAVQQALADLTATYREAFVLGVLQDKPYKEVAQLAGCSVQDIKTRVFRARAALSKKLSPYFSTAQPQKRSLNT